MNLPAAQILAMTVHRAMGSRIKYRSRYTNRVRTGTVSRITGNGVLVEREAHEKIGYGHEFVTWGEILELKEGA